MLDRVDIVRTEAQTADVDVAFDATKWSRRVWNRGLIDWIDRMSQLGRNNRSERTSQARYRPLIERQSNHDSRAQMRVQMEVRDVDCRSDVMLSATIG